MNDTLLSVLCGEYERRRPMTYKIQTYAEYLEKRKKYPSTAKCFVAGCNEPGYYEGGDARFYCSMCEKHARMKEYYLSDLKYIKRKLECRLLWDKSSEAVDDLARVNSLIEENSEG